jgi:hypothetical protein
MIWRDWNRVERLTLVGVIGTLLAAVAAWLVVPEIRTIISKPNIVSYPQNKSTESNVSKTNNLDITVITSHGNEEDLLNNIRNIHQVRKLEVTENDLVFSVAPRGVYGFGYGHSLQYGPGVIKLNRNNEFTKYEYHKLKDGVGEIIGFLSPDVASYIVREDRPAGFHATIYNKKWINAPALVSIPLNIINNSNNREVILDDGTRFYCLDIILK